MTIGKRLAEIREKNGYTRKRLAEELKRPYRTVTNYERDVREPGHDYLIDIAKKFHVSTDYILGIDSTDTKSAASKMTEAAKSVALKYDKLDEHGKKVVELVLDEETSRMQAEAEQPEVASEPEQTRGKVIPLLGGSFAAGPGEPDFGNLWSDFEISSECKAEFAIKITGDSMEPYLHDGEIAFGKKRNPSNGEVGAFLLDGEFLCKQYVEDMFNNIYLLSLNRTRSDMDRTLLKSGDRRLVCFGTIIMDEKPPLPNNLR